MPLITQLVQQKLDLPGLAAMPFTPLSSGVVALGWIPLLALELKTNQTLQVKFALSYGQTRKMLN